jgi:hypothetical protein
MAEHAFDMTGLMDRINKIKKEGEESTDFTLEFLQCLMERHDLASSIPEDFELDDVPDSILSTLRSGELPSKENLMIIEADTQNFIIFELIWLCGMNAISFYTEDIELEEGEPSIFDSILTMLSISPGHFVGCYLISVYTLLMCKVPSVDMMEIITDNFNSEPDRLMKNQDIFIEMAAAILLRWKEDKVYYYPEIPPSS